MEFFLCLSDIEWELIHVNSELIISKIQKVEDAKRAERRERELRELAEFQTMEIRMLLEEKEAVMLENARQDAEQARERIELVEFEMLEKQFENEEKLAALKKELYEERCQKDIGEQNISSQKNDIISSVSGDKQQQQRSQKVVKSHKGYPGILSNKPTNKNNNNNNNNNNNIGKKVRFVGLHTEATVPIDVSERHIEQTGRSIRKYKPSVSKIPKLFKVHRRNQ